MNEHSEHSTYREKLLEHLLIGELLKISWCSGSYSLEVAKPEVDRAGYDVILEANRVTRHVQLKAAQSTAKTSRQNVHTQLETKPSGCVVVVVFNQNLDLGPFLFFGADPGRRLPSLEMFKTAKHTKGNAQGVKAERPHIRQVPHSAFVKLNDTKALYQRLFGQPE